LRGPSAYPSAGKEDPFVGRTIGGKFLVERLLGAGAMGAVYRAHQLALERTVAIKVMHGAVASDATYVARFQREARAVSRLDHPNLIRIYDYGQEPDGLLYIAMEFLDGSDLFTVLQKDWPLSHARIVDIFSQTLSALAEAHDAGILHRDLKPENIMLLRRQGDDGRPIDVVKVCDFGIASVAGEGEARATPSGRKLTAAGLVVGTPAYMSPEQARGESCDARSDIYALGVTLYELLTGRVPFEGDNPFDVIAKALHDVPPPFDSHGVSAAPGLEPICLRAMSKAPSERYQTAREMRGALRSSEPQSAVARAPGRVSLESAPTQEVANVLSTDSSVARSVRNARPARRARFGLRGMLAGFVTAGALSVAAIMALRWVHRDPRGETSTNRAAVASTFPTIALSAEAPPVAGPAAAATALDHEAVPAVPPPATPAPARTLTSMRKIMTGQRAAKGNLPPTEPSAVAPLPAAPVSLPEPSAAASLSPASPAPAPTSTSVATAMAPPSAPPIEAPPLEARPAAPPPRMDRARVEIGRARSNNAAASGSQVTRAVSALTASFTDCYRTALAQVTNAEEVSATLHLESDDQGYVTTARVEGAVPGAAARCIERVVVQRLRVDADTGVVNADVALTLRPR
jgi:serine/threonine protein kinase